MSRFTERLHKSKKKKKTQYNSSYCELGPPVLGLKYLHQPSNFVLNILTLTCNV